MNPTDLVPLHQYTPSQTSIAKRLGVSRSLVSRWSKSGALIHIPTYRIYRPLAPDLIIDSISGDLIEHATAYKLTFDPQGVSK